MPRTTTTRKAAAKPKATRKAQPRKAQPRKAAKPKATRKAEPRKAEPRKAQPKSEQPLTRDETIAAVRDYVAAHGSTAIDAAWHGNPFVHNGRVYLQAVGRAESGGLAGFLGSGGIGAGTLAASLRDAGFVRQPFSVTDPATKKQTARSHYSAPAADVGITLGERTTARRERIARKAEVVQPKRSADDVRAKADDKTRAKLDAADAALNAAFDAVSKAKGQKAKGEALDAARDASAKRARVYAAA